MSETVDTSILNVSQAQVSTDKGLVNETNYTFSVPSIGAEVGHDRAKDQVAPVRGEVNPQTIVDHLKKEMGPTAVAQRTAEVGQLFSMVQKSMVVKDSTKGGIELDRKTNKPVTKIMPPEFIPVGQSIADLSAEKRKAATKIPLGE